MITALLAAVAVAIIYPEVDKLKWSMLSLDALALGLYAVNGTSKAMMYHMSGTTAVFLGMFTALGGGLIRDMLINEVPMVIRDKHWYAVPSAVGCVLTVLVCKGVNEGIVSFPAEVLLDVLIVVLMVAMRLISVFFDIQLPGALARHNTYLPSEAKYLNVRSSIPIGMMTISSVSEHFQQSTKCKKKKSPAGFPAGLLTSCELRKLRER